VPACRCSFDGHGDHSQIAILHFEIHLATLVRVEVDVLEPAESDARRAVDGRES
jgi:hypothetical protein